MASLINIMRNFPEIKSPEEKRLSFNVKLKWTLIILVLFFVLGSILVYGASEGAIQRFKMLEVIMGASFGSIISLGIGPIVMASIILQLLVGSQILKIDTSTKEGKKYFQGLQKILIIFFILFESSIYVLMGGIKADAGMAGIVIAQLCLGGLAIMFMDEIMSKWGFGSGVSLFIAAGVSKTIFTSLFQFINAQRVIEPSGRVLVLITSIINGNTTGALLAGAAIIATILIFLIVVWAQSLKIEIPLSYDRLRGYAIKWPMAFFYTSVIPVILVSALSANIHLFGGLLQNTLGHPTILGGFSEYGTPISGFSYYINHIDIVTAIITNSFQSAMLLQLIGHILFYISFSVLFAIFWVKTSGMDAQSQAKSIINSGLTIPGFRKDERILESVLDRYIFPLTIMGGIAIGLLASISNVLGVLAGGTSILLAIMIMYQFYQNIAQQHAVDMHPALRKFIK